jgi:hypothetical protein
MRTKTLLLSAVALAAGIFTSQAQSNVYSANIVGYVNATNAAATLTMLSNPLDNGTNDLYSLLPTAANNTVAYEFTGGILQTSTKTKGVWTTDFILPPGSGFFIKGAAGTNTFTGQTGFTNGLSLTAGVTVLAGSPIPFSGQLSDQGTNTLNLNILPNNSVISKLVSGVLQTSTKTKGVWTQPFTINPGDGFYVKSYATTNIVQILSIQ